MAASLDLGKSCLTNMSFMVFNRTVNRLQIPNNTCMYTMSLPHDERCEFVKVTPDCSLQSFHILKPYEWIFCVKSELLSDFGILAMCLSFIMLFMFISVVADAFVCPNIAVIASTLRLSDNIAGVTLLAFGNGAPDLFASFAGADLNHPEILYAGVTGSALLVTSLVAGLVIWSRPFNVNAWPLVTNISFLLLSYSILFSGFYFRNFQTAHCIGMLLTYVLYLSVTIVEEMVNLKYLEIVGPEKIDQAVVEVPPPKKQRASVAVELFADLERKKKMGIRPSMDEGGGYSWTKVRPLFKEFLEAMTTIKKEDWHDSSKIDKVFLIIQGVNQFWIKLILPVVNPEQPHDGWCKLLIMINMVIYPHFVLFALGYLTYTVGGIPLWVFSTFLGVGSAIIVFFTTKSYLKPRYHSLFAFFGFLAAILMIRILALEVIVHLETCGARFTLSQPLLALTCLAFGNSLGDLVINLGLAKQGMQNMSIAACFGSPMFNCSLGVGLISLSVFLKTGEDIDDYYGALSPAASLYLYISLFGTLIFLTLMNFEARSSHGLFLITLYCVYLLLILLMENVIHPFGTQYFRHKEMDDNQ